MVHGAFGAKSVNCKLDCIPHSTLQSASCMLHNSLACHRAPRAHSPAKSNFRSGCSGSGCLSPAPAPVGGTASPSPVPPRTSALACRPPRCPAARPRCFSLPPPRLSARRCLPRARCRRLPPHRAARAGAGAARAGASLCRAVQSTAASRGGPAQWLEWLASPSPHFISGAPGYPEPHPLRATSGGIGDPHV